MAATIYEQAYAAALDAWKKAPDRSAKRQVVQSTAAGLGVAEATVYRHLQELRAQLDGKGGRRTRSDRGKSQLSAEEREALAQLTARGVNKRGQPNVPLVEAVDIARRAGLLQAPLSTSQIGRQLRAHGLDLRTMRAAQPAIGRVSSHPNHVWLADVSVAVQWYLRDAAGQKVSLREDMFTGGLYEGKLERYRALREVMHRYLSVDHYSGAFYVRYYYSAGENSLDAADFLYRSMAPKERPQSYPLRGIPARIVFDRGPAFKNGLIQTLLQELGLPTEGEDPKVEYHAPGNPKASGAVEKAHDLWQRRFEGRLAQMSARTLDELNAHAEAFAALLNAERIHSRHRQTRSALWSTIRAEQLREAPPRSVFLSLASMKRQTGTLDGRLWLQHNKEKWELKGGAIYPGCKVRFAPAPFLDVGLRAWDEHGTELACTRLSFDPVSGFQTNGRMHRWDDAEAPGATAPAPPAQKLAAQVRTGEMPKLDLDGLFDDLGERLDRHAFLTAQGKAWEAPASSALAASPVIGELDAREEIAGRVGRRLDPAEWAWWEARITADLTRETFDHAWQEWADLRSDQLAWAQEA